MCCRQVALDAEVARLHAAERTVPCDGGKSKMDLLCKTSDAARAGLQVGGRARPDRMRRDAMGGTATNGTQELPIQSSTVSRTVPVQFWHPQDLAGERGPR